MTYDGEEMPIQWEPDYPLYDQDPECDHDIETQWSGYKCVKCLGWFCL